MAYTAYWKKIEIAPQAKSHLNKFEILGMKTFICNQIEQFFGEDGESFIHFGDTTNRFGYDAITMLEDFSFEMSELSDSKHFADHFYLSIDEEVVCAARYYPEDSSDEYEIQYFSFKKPIQKDNVFVWTDKAEQQNNKMKAGEPIKLLYHPVHGETSNIAYLEDIEEGYVVEKIR